jgi:RHS repeat-associated protein
VLLSYEEYFPHGASSYRAADSSIGVSAKRYRYASAERDEETGLDSMGARYYAGWLGRWTSADPIGLGDGVNRYAYVGGNPVGMRDPGGMKAEEPNEAQQAAEAQKQKAGESSQPYRPATSGAPASEEPAATEPPSLSALAEQAVNDPALEARVLESGLFSESEKKVFAAQVGGGRLQQGTRLEQDRQANTAITREFGTVTEGQLDNRGQLIRERISEIRREGIKLSAELLLIAEGGASVLRGFTRVEARALHRINTRGK